MATDTQEEEFEQILDPQYSRYINLRVELEAYLTEKYGEGKDFKVFHENDRWCFVTPKALTKKELKNIANEVAARRAKNKGESEAAS